MKIVSHKDNFVFLWLGFFSQCVNIGFLLVIIVKLLIKLSKTKLEHLHISLRNVTSQFQTQKKKELKLIFHVQMKGRPSYVNYNAHQENSLIVITFIS